MVWFLHTKEVDIYIMSMQSEGETMKKFLVYLCAMVLVFGIARGTSATTYTTTQITFDQYNHWETSMNNNGEIVWLATLNDSGTDRAIVSNVRGTIANGITLQHPFINNNGSVVWDQSVNTWKHVFQNGAQVTTGNKHHIDPAFNASGEIVWAEQEGTGEWQIVSNVRGQITTGEDTGHLDPGINDNGEILWVETNTTPYKIVSNENDLIAEGSIYRFPSINNNGQIVWSGAVGNSRSIFSNFDGILDLGEGYQDDPSINDYGQISYTQLVDEYYQVFYATPIPEPAPVPEPATILLLGTALVGFAGARRKFKK